MRRPIYFTFTRALQVNDFLGIDGRKKADASKISLKWRLHNFIA